MSYQLYRNTTLGKKLDLAQYVSEFKIEFCNELTGLLNAKWLIQELCSEILCSVFSRQSILTPVYPGHTLQESLDELMQLQMPTPALALRVLIQFDKSINNALATRVKTKGREAEHIQVLWQRVDLHAEGSRVQGEFRACQSWPCEDCCLWRQVFRSCQDRGGVIKTIVENKTNPFECVFSTSIFSCYYSQALVKLTLHIFFKIISL